MILSVLSLISFNNSKTLTAKIVSKINATAVDIDESDGINTIKVKVNYKCF